MKKFICDLLNMVVILVFVTCGASGFGLMFKGAEDSSSDEIIYVMLIVSGIFSGVFGIIFFSLYLDKRSKEKNPERKNLYDLYQNYLKNSLGKGYAAANAEKASVILTDSFAIHNQWIRDKDCIYLNKFLEIVKPSASQCLNLFIMWMNHKDFENHLKILIDYLVHSEDSRLDERCARIAVERDYVGVLGILKSKGFNFKVDLGSSGGTFLHTAAGADSFKAYVFLIQEVGLDPNIKNASGQGYLALELFPEETRGMILKSQIGVPSMYSVLSDGSDSGGESDSDDGDESGGESDEGVEKTDVPEAYPSSNPPQPGDSDNK